MYFYILYATSPPPPPHTHTHTQYTINAKKVEVAVKKIISGEEVQQRGALANPQSLDLYYNIPELQLSGQNH